jgi:hypothetical protein
MKISAKQILASLLAGLALTGCGSTEDDPLTEATPAHAVDAEPSVPAGTPSADAKPATTSLAETAESTPPEHEFAPPFPERLELFQPPQRAQSMARRDDEHGETVELKGFIHVDEPRVVLSIDGVVSSLPQGGEKYGVQVISIEPPTVVLQRGRNRWPATLE